MDREPSRPRDDAREFRRYRRAFAGLYVAVLSLSASLVLASIFHELLLRRGERGLTPTPADLAECSHDVRGLLEDLGRTAAQLQLDAVAGDARGLGKRWDGFASAWQARWEAVNARCQFDRLEGSGLGPAYDRLAWVHRALPALRLSYREMMKRFTDEQADQITAMRGALDRCDSLLREPAVAPPVMAAPLDAASLAEPSSVPNLPPERRPEQGSD